MPNPDQDSRNPQGRYIRTTNMAKRDARAATLRDAGWSFQAIADELGYGHRSEARQGVRRALREIVKGPATELLNLYLDRLEDLYLRAAEIMEADHVVVSHGKIVRDDDGKPLIDHGPTLAAIREARESLISTRKMVGLDQPAKVNLSGGVRYEVVGVDPADLK